MKPFLYIAAMSFASVLAGCNQTAEPSKSADATPSINIPSIAPPAMAPSAPSSAPLSSPLANPAASPAADNDASNASAAKASDANADIAAAADDSAITAKVKAALMAEPALQSMQINVETKNATVILSGTVAQDDLRVRAEQIASATDGVNNVVDNLTVKAS